METKEELLEKYRLDTSHYADQEWDDSTILLLMDHHARNVTENNIAVGSVLSSITDEQISNLADQFINSRFRGLDRKTWTDDIKHDREVFIAGVNAVFNNRE